MSTVSVILFINLIIAGSISVYIVDFSNKVSSGLHGSNYDRSLPADGVLYSGECLWQLRPERWPHRAAYRRAEWRGRGRGRTCEES